MTDGQNASASNSATAREMKDWFSSKAFNSVELEQRFVSDPEHNTDYYVVHESIFKPRQVACAMVTVLVTSDGGVGVGLETRGRVADRLGVRNPGRREIFATGFEPITPDKVRLIPLLEMVSNGQISLIARTWPILGLGKVSAAVATNYEQVEPIKLHPDWPKPLAIGSTIHFSPWS